MITKTRNNPNSRENTEKRSAVSLHNATLNDNMQKSRAFALLLLVLCGNLVSDKLHLRKMISVTLYSFSFVALVAE